MEALMGQLQHYRREIRAALAGMRGLSPEERGIYNTVLDLIYDHDGAVDDDEGFITYWCECDAPAWRRVRQRLVALGKLYAVNGTLRNPRADREVAEALQKRAMAQAAGRASGRARATVSCRIKGLAEADVLGAQAPDRPIDVARAEARDEIAAYVARLDPYRVQHIVAALLQAMGYARTIVSPPGPDGGTDILAFRDALGSELPHLRAQVKHRAEPTGREDVAALRGILRPEREIGLFVSTGGFTSGARREAEGASHIRLVDFDELIDLWIRHEATLPQPARAQLNLAPVFFLDMPRSSPVNSLVPTEAGAESHRLALLPHASIAVPADCRRSE
jgi:uncharacterized protein YdaU (DUF1376 family)